MARPNACPHNPAGLDTNEMTVECFNCDAVLIVPGDRLELPLWERGESENDLLLTSEMVCEADGDYHGQVQTGGPLSNIFEHVVTW